MIEMPRPCSTTRVMTQADVDDVLDRTVWFLNHKMEMGIERDAVQARLVPEDRLWGGGYGTCDTLTDADGCTAEIELRQGLAKDFAVVVMAHELTHFWMESRCITPRTCCGSTRRGQYLDEVVCELMGAVAAVAMRWDAMKQQQLRAARSFANSYGASDAESELMPHIRTAITRHSAIAGALLARYLSELNLTNRRV